MPISDPGRAKRGLQRGFSLLEMLLVLAIVGIATALAGIGAFQDTDARALRRDAERLAQLFPLAQAEARELGSPVLWRYDRNGYSFAAAQRHQQLPLAVLGHADRLSSHAFHEGALRPREWMSPLEVEISLEPPASSQFNTEWISGPSAVRLSDGVNSVVIRRSGNGNYEVQP